MRLLVLGGTRFLGRAIVDTALARGWHVTTLTRGESGPPPAAVHALTGDRTTAAGLAALDGGDWDVVVDTSGFVPRDVLASARALHGRVGHYVYVSSVSAYVGRPTERITADAPLHPCAPDAGPDDGEYGELKAGCERAVTSVFGEAATIVRAGLLMGPHDNTVRLSWWLARIARGGQVLAPGDPAYPAQLVDVRDLASWMLHCGEHRLGGAFIATSASESATFGQLIGECLAATGSDAQVAWVPDDFLLGHGIQPWTELPLWSPRSQEPHTWDVDSSGAADAGLVTRPLAETVADTWAWMRSVGVEAAVGSRPGFGIDPGREAAVLAAWLGRYPAGMAEREELLSLIRDLAVVRGKVTLSSGIEADYYVDLRRITLHHAAAPLVGTVMLDATSHLAFDAVGGLTLGADPVSTAMLHAAAAAGRKLDAFVVRKTAKAHGLQRRIEGPDIEGRRVLIVEDTSTTGGSPLTAADAAREAGAEVVAIATIVDRGAADAVRAAGYEYVSAFGVSDLAV